MLQNHSPTGKFDFIKFDIEGTELEVLNDEKSHPVICEATCFFMELHEWMRRGCKAALQFFLQSSCGQRFQHVVTTGEFLLFCQTDWTTKWKDPNTG